MAQRIISLMDTIGFVCHQTSERSNICSLGTNPRFDLGEVALVPDVRPLRGRNPL